MSKATQKSRKIIAFIGLTILSGQSAQAMQCAQRIMRPSLHHGMQQRQYVVNYVPGEKGSRQQIKQNEALSCEFREDWLPIIKLELGRDDGPKNDDDKSLDAVVHFVSTFDSLINLNKKHMPYRYHPYADYNRGEIDEYIWIPHELGEWMGKNGRDYDNDIKSIAQRNIQGACHHLRKMEKEFHKMTCLDHLPRKEGNPNKIMINKKRSERMRLTYLPILNDSHDKPNEDGIIEKFLNHFDELIALNEKSMPYRYDTHYFSDYEKCLDYELSHVAILRWMEEFGKRSLEDKKVRSAYKHLDELHDEFYKMNWGSGDE